MADTPMPTQIREALAERFRTIRTPEFRTDIGADVRTESSKWEISDGPRVTIYSATRRLPQDARSPTEREIQLVVEVAIPVTQGNELALCDAAEADIEDALRTYLQLPTSIRVQVVESLTLDRPDGLAAMVLQIMVQTRYRQ